jgi:Mn2+/Fe2+ NRAMP family transporter
MAPGPAAKRRPTGLLQRIGPGFISAASDNDPTTVATLAVIGSTTRYALCWLVAAVVPMLMVVQAVSARIGVICGKGLEDVVRERYGRAAALATLLLVLGVNVMTVGADLSGGAAAGALIFGDGSGRLLVIPLAFLVGGTLAFGSYERVKNVLRVILFVFVAYVVSAFLAHPDWSDVLRHTLIPSFTWSSDYIDGAIALLGTTLTSYAYFWETISTARERMPLRRLGMAELDAALGMVAAGVIFYFIVVGTGATLGVHHRHVETAQDAAAALKPIAGDAASLVFGIGLLGSALLALPVLAGTSAYVLAEALGWKGDLDARFHEAPRFYVSMFMVLAAGVAITFSGLGAIKLLFYSSIVAGVATPFTLALMMRAAADPVVMRGLPLSRGLKVAGWIVVAIVSVASVAFLVRTIG